MGDDLKIHLLTQLFNRKPAFWLRTTLKCTDKVCEAPVVIDDTVKYQKNVGDIDVNFLCEIPVELTRMSNFNMFGLIPRLFLRNQKKIVFPRMSFVLSLPVK